MVMNIKMFLGLFLLVLMSSSTFAQSYFVESDLIYADLDRSLALQDQKLELSNNKLDGYIKMLEMKSVKLSQDIYIPKKIVASK
jgi:hypothetical protein